MRGGRPTAQQSGLTIRNRDTLFERMTEYTEGQFFSVDDICRSEDEKQDFIALQGFDQLHVFDQYHTRIIETERLRRVPSITSVLESYCQARDCSIVKTGDRVAWERGYSTWEPIKGYRFYSDKGTDTLSIGRMKIKIIAAPEWLRDESEVAVMFRCFYDIDPKELNQTLGQVMKSHRLEKLDIQDVVDFGRSIAPDSVPEDGVDPGSIVERILAYINQPTRDAA